MKDFLKSLLLVVLVSVLNSIVYNFLFRYIPVDVPYDYQLFFYNFLAFVVYLFLLFLGWLLLFKSDYKGGFLSRFNNKKLLAIWLIIITLVFIYSTYSKYNYQLARQSKDASSQYHDGNVYENTKYHFKMKYPNGAKFANANPDSGFMTRFFLPDGESIGGDTENIGIYIGDTNMTLENYHESLIKKLSNNGKVDSKEVVFGGQKGFRLVYSSSYSASKNTQELDYFTIKDGKIYKLNYFPVAKNIEVVDEVAKSFEITQ